MLRSIFQILLPNRLKIIALIQMPITNLFDSLYIECQKDPSFDLEFIVIPSVQPGANYEVSVDEICSFLGGKGYRYRMGYDSKSGVYIDPIRFKPDIVLFQTPYDEQRSSKLYSAEHISQFAKVGHISYGSIMIEHVGIHANLIEDNSFYLNVWKVFVENAQAIDAFGPTLKEKIVPIGYMKMDMYINYANLVNAKKKIKRPSEKTYYKIVWKPRWIQAVGRSNLYKYLNYFIDFVLDKPNVDFILYLHPLIRSQISSMEPDIRNEIKSHFNRIETLTNFNILEGGDFLDYVWDADLFIGDVSSTMVEFALTARPIIYTPTEAQLNSFGEQIVRGAYTVKDQGQMTNTLEKLMREDDPLEMVRIKNKDLISKKDSGGRTIARVMLDYLKSEL